jgi:cell division initiation protein
MMTPQEVANCTFAKSMMGGYNMASVDDFLDKLTEDYAALYKENSALKAKLKITVDKMTEYRESEDAIRSTLLTAQKMSSAMISEAEQKRDAMIADAAGGAKARLAELQQQINDAERRLEAVRFQVDKELEAERRRLSTGQEQLRAFIRDVRAVCNEELAQLELLPELPAEEPKPAAPAVPIQVVSPAAESAPPQEKRESAPPSAAAPAPIPEVMPAFSAARAEGADLGEDPFADDGLDEELADTRVLNLDDLQFGPNYTKD